MDSCYTYVITLDGGAYYLGHTKELSIEIQDHYLGLVKDTSGKNPQLVWSEQCPDSQSHDHQGRRGQWNRLLLSENRDVIVHRLQARLPLGGFHWG